MQKASKSRVTPSIVKSAAPHRLFVIFLALVLPVVASGVTDSSLPHPRTTLNAREGRLYKTLARNSEFDDIPHTNRARCESVELPEAIATPNPLLIPSDRSRKVKVSFIIGTDGRVHAPLILESAGTKGDRSVLQTVRTWRYRPGTCNGVPTETEGKIEFSVR